MFSFSKLICVTFYISILGASEGIVALPNNIQIANPTFQAVYDGTLIFTPYSNASWISSPYGQRAWLGVVGGNVTNSTTGEFVGQIIPGMGGEFGILSSVSGDGKFFADFSAVAQWEDDKTYAFFKMSGISAFEPEGYTTTEIISIETGSASRQNLVKTMCLFSLIIPSLPQEASGSTGTTDGVGYFRLFVKSSPNPSTSS